MTTIKHSKFFAACLFAALLSTNHFSSTAHADEVDDLVELVKRRPDGKDRDQWREERRDAARQLGEVGDKRAVPALIQIVATEEFDAVANIAIVSLGKIGDKRAIPALVKVREDDSRDKFTREAAKDALKKLGYQNDGSKADTAPEEEDEATEDSSESSLASTGLSNSGRSSNSTVDIAPAFGEDILAAREELRFAVGQAQLEYNSVTSEASLDGAARAEYERLREGKSMALRYRGAADLVAGAVDYEGEDAASRLLRFKVGASAEARFYHSSGKLFGIGTAALSMGMDHLRVNQPGPDNTISENHLSADIAVSLGLGYGRNFDIGEKLRLRRMEDYLRKRKLLGRSISAETSEKLMRAWWQLRREQGYYKRLVATVTILRDAGVLLSEPNAGDSYGILRILEDGQLQYRPEGLQVHLALGENYLVRDDDLNLEEGRIESLLSRLRYGKQSEDGNQELLVLADARYRILADEEEEDASPWALSARAHWRQYKYTEGQDALGALDLGLEFAASDQGFEGSEMATRLGASAGWLWAPNRGSQLRLAAQGRVESGEFFLGALFEGSYGLVNAGYASGSIR